MSIHRYASRVFIALFGFAIAANECFATITSSQLPTMSGDTFAAEVQFEDANGHVESYASILNIASNHLTIFLYDPPTGRTIALHGAAVTIVTQGQSWNVLNPSGAVIASLSKNTSNKLVADSTTTQLDYIPPGQNVTLGLAPKIVLVLCCSAFALNGDKGSCCCCCVATHRAVGIPESLDCTCCFYLIGDSCCLAS